jgi:Subtilase family
MSFGFETSVPIIAKALQKADAKGTILLAAASNEGGYSNLPWPARLPTVIGIYASDGYGRACDFNPAPDSRGYHFAFPGLDVESDWPISDGGTGRKRSTGTSISTPIAASIAANILAYMRLELAARRKDMTDAVAATFRKLFTTAGMERVFVLMAQGRAGYDIITPWELFDSTGGGPSPNTVLDRILTDFRKRL